MRKLPQKQNRALTRAINAMVIADQRQVRKNLVTKNFTSPIFKTHAVRLQKIVHRHGWPTISKFGTKASRGAWLLVQHADHDVAFQERCLEFMQEAYNTNPHDVAPQNIAYLIDRVRVNKRQKQLFGTQYFFDSKGRFGPRPIVSPANLNIRRKQYGLGKFVNYKPPYTIHTRK